jgi:prevent-host-death family protein
MKNLSQRELRNDSGEILRQVVRGASFRVTNRGTPVAILAPIGTRIVDELTLREGTQRMEFPPAASRATSVAAALDELRGDR